MVSHVLKVLAQTLDVNHTHRGTYCMPLFPCDTETSRQFAEIGTQGDPILLHTVQWVFLQEVLDLHSIVHLSLIHISEPTRLLSISYAVFCLKKKKKKK